jgi:hypothetical protein
MNVDERWCDDWCKIGAWTDQSVLNFIMYLLRIEIIKFISAMGILIIKGLLVILTNYHLPKDKAIGVSWWLIGVRMMIDGSIGLPCSHYCCLPFATHYILFGGVVYHLQLLVDLLATLPTTCSNILPFIEPKNEKSHPWPLLSHGNYLFTIKYMYYSRM